STSKTPSYTKSVSWQHHQGMAMGLIFICGNLYYVSAKMFKLKFLLRKERMYDFQKIFIFVI
ncbi:hypothetical protein, partial [Escherichia coli]